MNTYTAFLRIRHPSIDPAEISEVLALTPAHAWSAGSPRDPAAPTRGAHAESYWFAPLGESIWPRTASAPQVPPAAGAEWQFAGQTLPLETFLLAQIRHLLPHRNLFAKLSSSHGSCELIVTLSARDRFSVELPAVLLRSLADLDIGLTLEVGGGDEPASH